MRTCGGSVAPASHSLAPGLRAGVGSRLGGWRGDAPCAPCVRHRSALPLSPAFLPGPQVWDFDSNGAHDLVGEVHTSLAALKAAAAAPAAQRSLELAVPPGKKGGAAAAPAPKLLIRQLMVREGPTPSQQLCGERAGVATAVPGPAATRGVLPASRRQQLRGAICGVLWLVFLAACRTHAQASGCLPTTTCLCCCLLAAGCFNACVGQA